MSPLLEVDDLRVSFAQVRALDGLSYSVDRGGAFGIVGDAGAGKTVAALAALGFTRRSGGELTGRVAFQDRDLSGLPERDLRRLRGSEIGLFLPDALHPFHTVGWQIGEAILAHSDISRAAARDRAIDLLELVGVPDARRRVLSYPHELADGTRRRVGLAAAIANAPALLVTDDPTISLDIASAAEIVALLNELRRRLELAIVIFTRDRSVAAEVADQSRVMRAGRLVE
jgi:peptide/nickel transport system ATP-binding protein